MCQCEDCLAVRDVLAIVAACERRDTEAVRLLHELGDPHRMLVAACSLLAEVLSASGTDPGWWAASLLEQHAEAVDG
jgi:hypothetical protein